METFILNNSIMLKFNLKKMLNSMFGQIITCQKNKNVKALGQNKIHRVNRVHSFLIRIELSILMQKNGLIYLFFSLKY